MPAIHSLLIINKSGGLIYNKVPPRPFPPPPALTVCKRHVSRTPIRLLSTARRLAGLPGRK